MSPEDQSALDQFSASISRPLESRYMVKLPRKELPTPLGQSRSQAVKRFKQNKITLLHRGRWHDFKKAEDDYYTMKYAERVPPKDLDKPCYQAYYMPMHGVAKECSTSTKLRIMLEASSKNSSRSSLNDILLLSGPTLYPLLTVLLLRFFNCNIDGYIPHVQGSFITSSRL